MIDQTPIRRLIYRWRHSSVLLRAELGAWGFVGLVVAAVVWSWWLGWK